MRLTIICSAIAMLVGCGGDSAGKYTSTMVFAPSPAPTTQLVPSVLPLTPFGAVCSTPHGFRWTTAFDLVVITTSDLADLSMDQVTFRLISGESVGGPSITFPKPQLADMFGTTVVARQGVFPFRLDFGCQAVRPRSIATHVVLVDRTGTRKIIESSAGFE